MQTLFGIRSNVAIAIVGSLYLIVTLHTSIYGFKYFKEFPPEDYNEREYLLINTKTKLFHIISLIFSLSCLLSSILLILGTIEKRYGILRPWLIVNIAIEIIFTSCFFYFICLLIQIYESSWSNLCGLLVVLLFTAIAMAFHDYLFNGTYALYKKLQREARRLYPVIDNEDSEGVYVV